MKRVYSLLVDNNAGVLSRIAGLFSRRGYSIDSITAGVTADPRFTRITIVASGDELILSQIEKQVRKLEDVIEIKVLDPADSVYRELIMVKIRADRKERAEIISVADIFRAKIVDVEQESLIVELTGTQSKLEAFLSLLEGYEILELARTGITGLNRGIKDVTLCLTIHNSFLYLGGMIKMAAKIYYQEDCNLSLLEGKKIAIIGYGSQGHAHALNLKESGCDVIVGLYEGSKSWAKAEAQGLKVYTAAEAAKQADIIMILINDEKQAEMYKKDIEPNLEEGNMLMFAHGFCIHFGQIVPPANVDVTMIAPKAPGHTVRSEYLAGKGTPCLVAVEQDYTGKALDKALAYALAIGGARAGVLETTFRTETETDESGFGGMRYSISNTAEYGDYITGPKIITEETKKSMKKILADIQDGSFAKDFLLEMSDAGGRAHFRALRKLAAEHQMEKVGEEVRSLYSWSDSAKLINN